MPDAETFDYANTQKLLAGDLGQLSGGQKLMALGALLRSAGRGSKTTPQEVLGTLRKEAQNKAVMQLQLAQMQAASARREAIKQQQEQYAGANPNKAKFILGLTPEEFQAYRIQEETPTARAKNIEFTRRLFGPKAAAQYAQYGGSPAPVNMPVAVRGPDGQVVMKTYYGPPSGAPGAQPWQFIGGGSESQTRTPPTLARAMETGQISFEDSERVRRSLGPDPTKFEAWKRQNNIRVVRKLNGKTYYQDPNTGEWYEQ